MTTLNRLLDAAQQACDPPTVIALTARLGVSRQTVYTWKSGELAISDEHLARVAKLANADPEDVVTVLRERATSEPEKAMWTTLARRLGAAAALAVALLPAGQANAGNARNPVISQGNSPGMYIMFSLRRLRRALTACVTPSMLPAWAPA